MTVLGEILKHNGAAFEDLSQTSNNRDEPLQRQWSQVAYAVVETVCKKKKNKKWINYF